MADTDENLLDEEDVDTADAADSTDDEQQGVTDEDLREQFRAFQAQYKADQAASEKRHRDMLAAVGRVQSAQAKFEKASGTGAAEAAQLQASIKAANDSIDAMLEDEAIDPKVREKVRSVRAAATSNSELDALRRQVAALEAGRESGTEHEAITGANTGGALSAFETAMEAAIEAAGLNPDDTELFDWAGEASRLWRQGGADAARTYFQTQIRAGLEAKAQASRRETRRTAGTAGAKPAGNAQNDLEVGTLEERMKKLRSMGAVV